MNHRVLKRLLITAGFVLAGLFSLQTETAAGSPDNFTCKLQFMGMSLPMAKMGQKTRVESVMFPDLVTLTFHDQKKTINMHTKNKTYFEHPLQERIPSIYSPQVVIEKKQIGRETVDGHPCIKYQAVFYAKDKPQEKYSAVLWEAQDLGGLFIKQEVTLPPEKKARRRAGKVCFRDEGGQTRSGQGRHVRGSQGL